MTQVDKEGRKCRCCGEIVDIRYASICSACQNTRTPSPATGSAVPASTVSPTDAHWIAAADEVIDCLIQQRTVKSNKPFNTYGECVRTRAYELAEAQAPKPASAGGDPRDTALGLMKERAQKLHKMVYDLCWKYPNVPEFGDNGVLHDAIHDVLRVDTPTAIAAEADTAKQWACPKCGQVNAAWKSVCDGCSFNPSYAEKFGGNVPAADRLAQTVTDALNEAYEAGWVTAAAWAKRDDLRCDVASQAYKRERDEQLNRLRARESAPAQPVAWRYAIGNETFLTNINPATFNAPASMPVTDVVPLYAAAPRAGE